MKPHGRLLAHGHAALLAFALLLSGGSAAAQAPEVDGWTPFEGNWSAAGQRRPLRAGSREMATIHLSGSLAVSKGEGLRKGFRAEAIAFDDGAGSGVGGMVLTDDRGDQVFCSFKGAAAAAGARIVAAITGGTGAYASLEGDFSFRWQSLTKSAEGEIHGLALDLKGRFRRSSPAASTPAEKPK